MTEGDLISREDFSRHIINVLGLGDEENGEGDLISRQAVEEMIKAEMPERGMWEIEGDKEKETVCEVCVDLMQKLSELPSVENKGEWKDVMYDESTEGIECTVCKEIYPWYSRSYFCPNCGADMRGE